MVRMVLLGGFLGAGKTSTMLRAAHRLEGSGQRPVVITNDQGDSLVDTAVGRAEGVDLGEVTGGCFCCRFDQLVDTAVGLVARYGADVVLAEAVGSCTDLAATVVMPLRRYYGGEFEVSPLTVVVDPFRYRSLLAGEARPGAGPMAYLFGKQLEEADIIALNKIDRLTEAETSDLVAELTSRFPAGLVVPYSAESGQGLETLVELWTGWTDGPGENAADVDYDVYAEAEARLAWLNACFQLRARCAGGLRPAEWVTRFVSALADCLRERHAFVGHVKVQLTTADGVTAASLVGADDRPALRFQQWTPVDEGQLLVNARVDIAPGILEALVIETVAAVDAALGTGSDVVEWSAFRPARPQPVHRLSAIS